MRRYYEENADVKEGTRWINIETRQYDDQGNFSHNYYFEGESPSQLDRTDHYQFDTNGNLVGYVSDDRADGYLDYVNNWQYDESGNVVRYEQGHGAKGNVDYVETWQYDLYGKPMQAQGSDATGNLVYTKTWQYDATGNLTRYEQDGSTDDAPESIQTWQYNAHGNMTRHETDHGDGETLIDSWLYDDDGNLTRFERNHERFSTPGEVESFQFHTTGWGHIFSGPIWWLYF